MYDKAVGKLTTSLLPVAGVLLLKKGGERQGDFKIIQT